MPKQIIHPQCSMLYELSRGRSSRMCRVKCDIAHAHVYIDTVDFDMQILLHGLGWVGGDFGPWIKDPL